MQIPVSYQAEGQKALLAGPGFRAPTSFSWLQLPPPLLPYSRTTHLSGDLHGNNLAEFFYHNFSMKIPWICHRTVSMIKVHMATDPYITIHCQNKLPQSYLLLKNCHLLNSVSWYKGKLFSETSRFSMGGDRADGLELDSIWIQFQLHHSVQLVTCDKSLNLSESQFLVYKIEMKNLHQNITMSVTEIMCLSSWFTI